MTTPGKLITWAATEAALTARAALADVAAAAALRGYEKPSDAGAGGDGLGQDNRMKNPDPHYRHRFPADLISHAAWLYHVFSLSFRDVELLPEVEHQEGRYLNNRVENSHRPTRRRERHMQRFKLMRQAQSFLWAHTFISGDFRPRRPALTAARYRVLRAKAFKTGMQGRAPRVSDDCSRVQSLF